MNQLVSIIIPAYNAEKTLKRCIDSVMNQSYTNFELIIVNDCSTDNTLGIVREYKDERIKIISNSKKLGLASRNNGFLNAHGELIYFLDSDDFIDANTLSETIAFINKN
ncbi:MAG: glycosyltransferase family 2 protein, partial [Bacilli bacterium]